MSTSAATLQSPTPSQIARGLAAALPADLSKNSFIGILGVIMGAGIVTLIGRMLTLGLADLKGHLGISYDDGAWIGSAFNVGLMFIGPFTVYLGALIPPRRILIFSAVIFTLLCAYLPFIHTYRLLIVALVLAGLTSGTFYPLTLTFALTAAPVRFLPFTLALYATFVDAAVNIAPALYGFYRNLFSWQWMFWTSVLLTPIMILCIYKGIPASSATRKSGQVPSFAGFLYASAGFALLYAALDQGERLDWWHSGLFSGLALSGLSLLSLAMVRRLRSPNPLVDLPYLRKCNTLLLGASLILFRFCLLATAFLIPQSLAIHGFQADQIGPAVIWTAAPQLIIAIVAALLLLSHVDPRLVLAAGFSCMAFAACIDAGLTSAWSAPDFYRTELLTGVGQSFAFVGLVSMILLQSFFSGGLSKPERILTFSAFFHTVRLFGGELGIAFMGHFIVERENLHSNLLGLHVQSGNWITEGNIRALTAGVYSRSDGLVASAGRAAELVAGRLRMQAYILTFMDAFYLVAWASVITLVLIAMLQQSPLNYGDLREAQQHLPASGEKR